jgi:hypothetical protein
MEAGESFYTFPGFCNPYMSRSNTLEVKAGIKAAEQDTGSLQHVN